MRIVVTGSIAFDYLMSFPGKFSDHLIADQLHSISLSFLVDTLRVQRGGIAPNIAYTNALLGGRPKIMAAAGRDFIDYGNWLEKQGVDTSGIVIFDDDLCASFFVNTDQDHNQIASFYTGAMANAAKLTFGEHAPEVELAIISPNDPAAMNAYVEECKQLGIPYVYDPSQQVIRLTSDALVAGIDGCILLTVNEYELGMIQEKTGLNRTEIVELAGGLLLTLGRKGSKIFVDGQVIGIPAIPPRQLIEPTGAGDAFRGGLFRGIQLELPWHVAGRMGALAATFVLENMGTQGHYYTKQEFINRYRELFDDEGALDVLLD